jgi:hypothetical protein
MLFMEVSTVHIASLYEKHDLKGFNFNSSRLRHRNEAILHKDANYPIISLSVTERYPNERKDTIEQTENPGRIFVKWINFI